MTTAKKKTRTAKTTKALEKPSKPDEKKVTLPEGISSKSKIVDVPLSKINMTDTRFQFRVDRDRFRDMVKSLEADGQQVPIVLWGKKEPYLIIDGHRRTRAAAELKLKSIKAIIREDLAEKDAYHLAFLENGKRKNFTKLDLAHALWVFVHRRRMTQEAAGKELEISADKAGRLLKLLELPEELQKAVSDGAITMHHALQLDKHKGLKLDEWLTRIKKEKLSVRQLAKALGAGTKKKGRKKVYFRTDGDGFFLSPIRFNPTKVTDALRAELLEALKKAVDRLESVEPKPSEDSE